MAVRPRAWVWVAVWPEVGVWLVWGAAAVRWGAELEDDIACGWEAVAGPDWVAAWLGCGWKATIGPDWVPAGPGWRDGGHTKAAWGCMGLHRAAWGCC